MAAIDDPNSRDDLAPNEGSISESLHGVFRLLRVMRLHKKTIGWCIAGSLVFATAYYVTAPRMYRATAKLLIIDKNAENLSGVADGGSADDTMATHRELVRSPVVVQKAIESLAPEHRVDLVSVTPSKWVETISDSLRATTLRRTKFVEVSYTSLEPEAAVAVVNEVINSYLAFVDQTHRSTASEVLDVLTVEKEKFHKELLEKQKLQQEFRERCGHLAIDQKDGVVDPLIGRAIHLNDSLMKAQQRRLELQASMASVNAAIKNGEDLRQYLALVEGVVGQKMMLSSMGLGQQDMDLLAKQQQRLIEIEEERRRLARYYGPNHAKMIGLNEQVTKLQEYLSNYQGTSGDRFQAMDNQQLAGLITRALRQSITQAVEQEKILNASFEHARQQASKQSGDLVQLDMLNREVSRLESWNDALFNKINAVDMHQVQAPIRASIVKEPLPDDIPVSPRFATLYAGAIFGGFLLGTGIVFVRDQMDDRFNSPDEMAQQLGLPVLSVVRQMEPLEGTGLAAVHMHSAGNSVESEAFRTLRTSLTLQGDITERLVISSAEPSDGKTTVSSNLAVAFAQVGKRTLVIDADLRKPGMTALMDLKGQQGVTDLLICEGDIGALAESCLVKTDLENLDVIPAGPRRPDAAELLSGPNFIELLAWAEARYDQVLVDCPPVLAVSDAQIIGRLVDGVIVVVTPEKNHRRLVGRACDSFLSAGCNVLGVVANRISNRSEGGYGYGYGYGQQYGYGHVEEETEDEQLDLAEVSAIAPTGEAWAKLADPSSGPRKAA